MTITLYINNAEDNRVDKTAYLVERATLTGTIRGGTSVENPTILLELPYDEDDEILAGDENIQTADGINIADIAGANTLIKFNYAYIPEFHRYYFVNDIAVGTNRLYAVSMKVDVLMSFKRNILELDAMIDRNEFDFDEAIDDPQLCTKYITETSPSEAFGESEDFEFDALARNRITLVSSMANGLFLRIMGELYGSVSGLQSFPRESIPRHRNLPPIRSKTISVPDSFEVSFISEEAVWRMNYYATAGFTEDTESIISCIVWPLDFDSLSELQYETNAHVGVGKTIISDTALEETKYPLCKYGVLTPYLVLRRWTEDPLESFLDCGRYAKYEFYIPFIGWTEIAPELIAGCEMELFYAFNFATGDANVFMYNVTKDIIVWSSSAKVGSRIGFASSNVRSNMEIERSLGLNSALSIIGGTLKIGANVGGAKEGDQKSINSIVDSAMNIGGSVANWVSKADAIHDRISGSFGDPIFGVYDGLTPLRRVSRMIPVLSSDEALAVYRHHFGSPLKQPRNLANMAGFTKVDSIHLDNVPCFAGERIELDSLLRSGVLL